MLVLHDVVTAPAVPSSTRHLPCQGGLPCLRQAKLYNESVRRLWAALLVFVFSIPLITPLFAHQPERKLPSCCRRDGKHGCGMMARAMGLDEAIPGTAGLRGTKAPCPLFPSGKASPATVAHFAQPPLRVLPGVTILLAAGTNHDAPTPSPAFRRGSHKRGPPAPAIIL